MVVLHHPYESENKSEIRETGNFRSNFLERSNSSWKDCSMEPTGTPQVPHWRYLIRLAHILKPLLDTIGNILALVINTLIIMVAAITITRNDGGVAYLIR